jgi:hypothetical protein
VDEREAVLNLDLERTLPAEDDTPPWACGRPRTQT